MADRIPRTAYSLRLPTGQLLKQPVGTVSVFDFEESSIFVDDEELRDLKGNVTLLRTNRGLLATVKASAKAPANCSRCLKDILTPVSIELEEEYVPVTDPITGAPISIEDQPDAFRIERDMSLDLHEALRQYTLMSEPAKPLCTAECAGLCPNCGADLNEGPCACPPATDDRWQRLAELRDIDNEGS